MKIKFKKLSSHAVAPQKAHPTDAGFDLTATSCVFDNEGNATYSTGIAVEIPEGYVGLLFPRSSVCRKDLALSNCVGVIDAGYRGEVKLKFKPTLVFADRDADPVGVGLDECGDPLFGDSDYEGSDQKDLRKEYVTFCGRQDSYPDVPDGSEVFPPRVYRPGDRIAQLIVMPLPEVEFEEADELSESGRGNGGFGSTGK